MKKLYGVTVAMTTPFRQDGTVDYASLEASTHMLIDKGVDCLYPCGTTGEMLRLTLQERMKVAETVIRAAAGRGVVYIHCGAATEEDTITLVQHAQRSGADGAGVVTPQFFSLEHRELVWFFVRVAKSVSEDFPIYLYNIPQCSGNDIPVSAVKEIVAAAPNVVGIKYSWADINRTVDYLAVGEGFSVMHGCDRAFTGFLGLGCDGTVSGCAGVFPEPFVAVYKAVREGRWEEARQLQRKATRIADLLHGGANMSYFKEALKLRGLDAGVMRRPQLDLTGEQIADLKQALLAYCGEEGYGLKL